MKVWRNLFCLAVAITIVFSCVLHTTVAAYTQDDYNKVTNEINGLRKQISEYESQASALAAKANTISNQIAILQNQQATLKTQIDLKQAEHDQLVIEIETVQNRINENSDTVGFIIAQFYYNDSVSTIERLASSENFSTFVDEEVKLTSISDTLSDIIEENKNLKEELTVKKKNAELILKDLNTQKQQLAASEAEQAKLLAETRSSEAEYQKLKDDANGQKAELEKKQQAILADLARQYGGTVTPGDPGKGGYPYSSVCPKQKDAYSDRWGMYICECVSYTAWKVYQTYGYMPYWGGRGNANQWLNNARAAGYLVTTEPKPGYVGISLSGPYGHAVWVEWVNGNQVHVSQYNWTRGEYSEMTVNKAMFTYIYFGK
ncbi:MAG: CHAP domain-containing protein [Candidatus Saccharibacteria bacterium]|nr:CHAP domain-containing protein [Candidatus Saccharibacteria bacterium]